MTTANLQLEQPIRIVSDLHLGNPNSLLKNVDALAPVIEGARTMVFNGDTREDRIMTVRGQAEKSYGRLVELCNTLGAAPVFLCGNHDPEISPHQYLDLCGGRVFITHGDLLFPSVTPWSREIDGIRDDIERINEAYGAAAETSLDLAVQRLCEVRSRVSVELVRASGGSRIENLLVTLGELWPPRRLLNIVSIWRQTPALARAFLRVHRPDVECMIIGHTHRRQLATNRSPFVVNTGAFAPGLGRCVVEIDEDQPWTRSVRYRMNGCWHLGRRRLVGRG